MEEGIDSRSEIRQKTAKPLMWVGIVSIVMFFGGLTSAAIVEYGNGSWVGFELPGAFWLSTVFIVLSSATYILAGRSVRQDNLSQLKVWVGLTLLLGLCFLISQIVGWRSLTDQGVYFTGEGHTNSASYFYVLTLAHFAHAIGGLISLSVVFGKSLKSLYNSKNLLGLQISATYWHFLGILWIYLFVFLNYINQNF